MLKRWTKLVQGLRIRQRLIEQYADRNVPVTGASSSTSGTAKADSHARDGDAAVDNQPADEVRVFPRFCGSVAFLPYDTASPHPTRAPGVGPVNVTVAQRGGSGKLRKGGGRSCGLNSETVCDADRACCAVCNI